MELSYLHPKYFTPDIDVLEELGVQKRIATLFVDSYLGMPTMTLVMRALIKK